jgi:acyl carrier protein
MARRNFQTPQDIKQQVRIFLRENFLFDGGETSVRDDTSFIDGHLIDSTGVIELVSFLERTFTIKVEEEEMIPENLDSLAGIERYIVRKVMA